MHHHSRRALFWDHDIPCQTVTVRELWTQCPQHATFVHWVFPTKIIRKRANAWQAFSGFPYEQTDSPEGKQWSPTSQGILSTNRHQKSTHYKRHHKLPHFHTFYEGVSIKTTHIPLSLNCFFLFLCLWVCKSSTLDVYIFSPMTSHTLKVKWVVSSLVHLPSVSVSPRTILKLRRIERFSPTISFYYQSTFMENPYMFHIYSLVYKAHLYIIIYVMFESSFLQSRERRTLHNYLQDNCS